ncbi:MAG: ATP-binding cassette domain-containing protein [Burkholderiales bacterium]|nr:ATP-binding cassette domain-containing protein [Burkholderiales bacterium]
MFLALKGIRKSYGDSVAVDDVDLDVNEGEFVCILGPSGCGKTTLLRILAGLVLPDAGTILQDGRDLTRVPARHRGFGIVFQSYSLFPNLTAAENVGYGMRVRRMAPARIRTRVEELLALIGLPGSGGKHPDELSGGEQQRVALARAIAVDPTLLLLDEPLSALDAQVRIALRHEVRALQQRLRIPTLMVTHDQDEAMEMADRIVCMNRGRIEQVGTPRQLYDTPATPFVAGFVGSINFLSRALAQRLAPDIANRPGARFAVRPEALRLAHPEDRAGVIAGTVTAQCFLGGVLRVTVTVHDEALVAVAPPDSPWLAGMPVSVSLPGGSALAFDDERR